MRIYGDYSFFTDKMGINNSLQMKVSQGSAKTAEFADKFIEEHKTAVKDQIMVSKEGMEHVKESDKFYADIIQLNSDTVNEYGVSQNLYLDINNAYMNEMKDKDSRDWNSHMEALAKAYASVRKKITEGYENGTRTVWMQDDSAGEDFKGIELNIDGQTVRYRKLTKEEEISMLDKAIDKFTEKTAEWYVKEEESIKKEEAEKEAFEAYKEENKDWISFERLVNSLVSEAKALFDRVKEEIARLEAMNEKEIDFEGRMESESYAHRTDTVARGKQQAQLANYRKMSRMVSDVMTIWGNVRA